MQKLIDRVLYAVLFAIVLTLLHSTSLHYSKSLGWHYSNYNGGGR